MLGEYKTWVEIVSGVRQFIQRIKRIPFSFYLRASAPQPGAGLFELVFIMLGKMGYDGRHLGADEILALEKFLFASLNFSPADRTRALRALREGGDSPLTFEQAAVRVSRLVGASQSALEALVDVMLSVVYADGVRSLQEAQLLEAAKRVFGLSEASFSRLEAGHIEAPGERRNAFRGYASRSGGAAAEHSNSYSKDEQWYRILESSRSDSDAVIKKRYRLLVMKLHPDRVLRDGMPPEFKAQVERRFRELQDAWEHIKQSRGLH